MVAYQAAVEASDFWHVVMAPGETKVLTLEQLDDLFRLDIIDAATRVWQPGMSEWLPLSVVAGLEAEPVKAQAAPPAPSSRAPARPPTPPQRPPVTANFAAAPARPVTHQPSFQPGAAPTGVALPWASSPAPTQAAVPWASSPVPAQAQRPAPESFRPMVVSHRPMPVRTGGGAAGRFVLALALIAGVGVTLYRNDVLRKAAVSAGKETTYLKVEAALGGPGFGTPRAVQLSTPVSLNAAVAEASVQAPPPVATQARALPAAPAPQEPARTTEPEKPSTNSASETKPVSLSSLVAAKLPAKTKAERPSPAAPRAAARSSAGAARSSEGLGIKGSSNGYDPLNGKL